MTECIQKTFGFQELGGRKVEPDFRGGNLSADGGVLLLCEVDLRTGMVEQLEACFSGSSPWRWATRISTTMTPRAATRSWRWEWASAIRSGSSGPARTAARLLVGKSTLNRHELTNAKTSEGVAPGGVHKIVANHDAIETLLIRLVVSRLPSRVSRLAPDSDECEPTEAVARDLRQSRSRLGQLWKLVCTSLCFHFRLREHCG